MKVKEKIPETPDKKTRSIERASIYLSIALHLSLFILLLIFVNRSGHYPGGGGGKGNVKGGSGGSGGMVYSLEKLTEVSPLSVQEDIKEDIAASHKNISGSEKISSTSSYRSNKNVGSGKHLSSLSSSAAGGGSGYPGIEGAGFDSTGLGQVYAEPTLNVRMKYPSGWVYMDQNNRSKLDGVTFWMSDGLYSPPPYLHLEVVDKYMFNPSRYKYKYDFPHFTGYYNDPEELEGQVSQTIYVRTDDDEDYKIKLIMQGREQFKQFQPVFFAIVRSFNYGNSFF